MRRDLFIKSRVGRIEILLIHFLDSAAKSLAEALIMDDFPLPQELYNVVDVRIVAEPQNVVIGRARLLLRCHVLGEVGYHVALDRHGRRIPRKSRSRRRINARRMVNEVCVKACLFYLLHVHRARELMDYRAYHLKMTKLFSAQRSIGNVPMYQI